MRNYDSKFDSRLHRSVFFAIPSELDKLSSKTETSFYSVERTTLSSVFRAQEDSINFVALIELEYAVGWRLCNTNAILIYSWGKRSCIRSISNKGASLSI